MSELATIALAVIGSSVLASIISAWAFRVNERHADNRHLRDRRADRLRATFMPLLTVAEASADVVRVQNAPLQPASPERRDEELDKFLSSAMDGYMQARIGILLEPRGKEIDELFRETVRTFRDVQYDIQLNRDLRAQHARHDQLVSWDTLAAKEKKAVEAADALQAAMLQLLDELEQPMPPRRRWLFWRD